MEKFPVFFDVTHKAIMQIFVNFSEVEWEEIKGFCTER
jgi:hypothetical protein